MDPSIRLCKIRNSFIEPEDPTMEPQIFTYMSKRTYRVNRDVIYEKISIYKNTFPTENNETTETPEILKNNDSVGSISLANIDAVFNLTGQQQGYVVKQNTKDFTFAVLGDENGGEFSEYLQFRLPNSYGFGYGTPWNTYRLDLTHFNIFGCLKCSTFPNRNEISGKNLIIKPNLKKNVRDFIQYVKKIEPIGMNLIISSLESFKSNIVELLLTNLSLVRANGDMVMRMKYETLNKSLIKDLIYIVCLCFTTVSLFIPISDRESVYLVARKAYSNNLGWIEFLGNLDYTKSIKSLLKSRPKEFDDWIAGFSTIYDETQSVDINHINFYECRAIWNLP